MKQLTINELKAICEREINAGNGNKEIYLSDDDEGNGYHGLYYHFTPITNESFGDDETIAQYFNVYREEDIKRVKENGITLG